MRTESGAEGINLQFCSVLVNFDLPWNPQRVEQRIGRCHRYGQKIDVTVVNMLNRRNRAEQRVYELLDQKFRLFSGVFGASDEVLGVIESGIDFERKVVEAVQRGRTDAEVEAEFQKIEEQLQGQIDADMRDARRKLFDEFDRDVVALLRQRGEEITVTLDTFEQRLLTVAKAELPNARFHPGNNLAREGAHVIVNARANQAEADSVVREAQALGVGAISIIADMAKKDQVEAMAAKALSEFGRVDILINNAAIRPHMPFRELTDEDWEHVRNVVLDGALYLTRALIGPRRSSQI